MAITLRIEKGSPLTYNELDENFTDLESRLNAIEVSDILSVNGKIGEIILTTADVAENGNLYFTNARVDSRVASYTSDNINEGTTNRYFTEARARSSISAGAGLSYDSSTGIMSSILTTTDVDEGTNLYFTNDRVDTRLAATSITALSDVSYVGTPEPNYVLTWNDISGAWEPAEAPGAAGGESNTGSNLGGGQGIFAGKFGVNFRFYTLSGTNGISIASPVSNVIAISNSQDLSTTASPTFANVNISNLRLTNNSITTASTDGDLTLSGNGTGRVIINGGLSVTSGTSVFSNLTINNNIISNTDTDGDIILSPTGIGALLSTKSITAPRFISNVATGTAPFTVTSTTQVANLNVATAGTALTVTTAAQPNITSVGILTGIVTSGSITSTATNANLNLGNLSASNTPFIDFYSSGNNIDYDSRIIAVGGNGAVGSGTLTFVAGNVNVSSIFNIGNLTLTTNTISASNANGDILLSTNGTGKVGINKIPTYQLDVTGTIGANSLTISNSVVIGTTISDTLTINSAIANSLFPSVSNNIDLGSGTLKFRSGYFGSNIFVDGFISSTLTNGSITLSPTGSGTVQSTANIIAPRFISNIDTGTAPFTVTSTTQVANLNVATAGYAQTAGIARFSPLMFILA